MSDEVDKKEARRPSWLWSGLAALCPTVGITLGAVLVFASSPYLFSEFLHGGGFYGLVVVGATFAAWLGLSVLLLLASRGLRVPAALGVGLAGLPIALGALGKLHGSGLMFTLEAAEPSSRQALVSSRAFVESEVVMLVGAAIAGTLLAAFGLGLALAAIGQRAPGRSPLGVGVVVAVLPLAGVGAYGAFLASSPVLALVSLGALATFVLAGIALGDDPPHGRSGALAASAAVAAVLAVVVAWWEALATIALSIFGRLANTAPDERIAYAASQLAPFETLRSLGWAALALAVVAAPVVAGLAVARRRPTLGAVFGGVGVWLVAASLVGGVGLVDSVAGSRFTDGAQAPGWTEEIAPIRLPRSLDPPGDRVDATVTSEGLEFDGGARTALDRSALVAAFVAQRDSLSGRPHLALDRGLRGGALRVLLEAANDARFTDLSFVGITGDKAGLEEVAAVTRVLPAIVAVVGVQTEVVEIALEREPPPDAGASPDTDPTLFHVVVQDTLPTRAEVRTGASVTDDERSLEERGDLYREPPPLYIAFTDEAPVELIVQTVARARERRFEPVLVRSREVPGHPERALGAAPSDVAGEPASEGRLDREIIQRVIRRHQSHVRFCYERRLAARPELEGRLTVEFVIAADGSVATVDVTDSTLDAPSVEECVAGVVRRMSFPAPDGGVVRVRYPFVFTSS